MSVQVKGTIATAIDAGSITNKQAQGTIDARRKSHIDYYTADGSEVIGSTIKLCAPIPVGAIIRNVDITHDDLGASVTYSVGDVNDTARYLAAGTDGHAAAKESCKLTKGIGYTITGTDDTQLYMTIAGATLTAAAKIRCMVEYCFD